MKSTMLTLIVAAALAQAQTSPLDARVEAQLIPITAQFNALNSEHYGSGARLSLRLNRYLAGYASGFGNWYSTPSSALDELTEIRRLDDYWPEQVLSTWQFAVGVESIPLSGTFQMGDSREGQFGLVLRAGLGLGGTRVRLKPPTKGVDGQQIPPTWGDAGLRLVGDFGVALRFGFGSFAIHLGPRLSMWSDEVTRVNGCSLDDLRAMEMKIRGGIDPSEAAVSPSCIRFANSNEIPLALNYTRVPRVGLVLNCSADLGVSWSF